MKIDKNTKMALGGIAVLGTAYLLFKPKDESFGGFGGGGFGGLPAIVEESTPEGDIIYNLPAPAGMDMGVEWDKDDDKDPETKKGTYTPSLIKTYPLEYYGQGGVSPLSSLATPEQKLKNVMTLRAYQDPLAYAFSGRTESLDDVEFKWGEGTKAYDTHITKKQIATPKEPTQWGDASVGGFWDFLKPITQIGKGATGRSGIYDISKQKPTKVTDVKLDPIKSYYDSITKADTQRTFLSSLYNSKAKPKKQSVKSSIPGMIGKEQHEDSGSKISYKTYKEQYKLMNP